MTTQYTTAGPVSDDAYYVRRDCDAQFDDFLAQRYYITLLGPRRCGKTNLLARKYKEFASKVSYLPIYIYMDNMSKAHSEAEWYARFWSETIRGAHGAIKPRAAPINENDWRDTLFDVLEDDLKGQIVVFLLDDVHKLREPYCTPFMATVREMFSTRGIEDTFKRLIFVLSGSFLPEDLIKDRTISPFTVAKPIYMQDAAPDDLRPLIEQLGQTGVTITPAIFKQIYSWTYGDVYLTQTLCALLAQEPEITTNTIDRLAYKQLPQDSLFVTVRQKIEAAPYLLDLVSNIISPATPRQPYAITARDIAEAWLTGLIKEDQSGNCTIRNPVYHHALHLMFPKRIAQPTNDKTSVLPSTATHQTLKEGQYKLLRQIGKGAMGRVFLGQDKYGKVVAIKQLSVDTNDSIEYQNYRDRFLREGEVMKTLNHHTNIVGFIDHFVEDSFAYIVMDYVSGGSLKDKLDAYDPPRLPFGEVIPLMRGLASALQHAHNHRVIHRDIKPQNILLTSEQVPRLADFGVARVLNDYSLTTDKQFIGSLRYSSPEALDGSKLVSERSDLWSLGVVMFETMAGVPLIQGETITELCTAITHRPLPDIRKVRPDTPIGMVMVLTSLLERDLNKRCPSARELLIQLDRLAAS